MCAYKLKIRGVVGSKSYDSIDDARKSAYKFCKSGEYGTTCEIWSFGTGRKGKLIGNATRFFDDIGWFYHGKGKGFYKLYSSGSVKKSN